MTGLARAVLMLDICAGLGGASQAMRERGWTVWTVDNNPDFRPDIVADIRSWSWSGPRPDLVWCSPPCDDFAREWMPWSKTGKTPDMTLVEACRRVIAECNPRYWIIENVKGAQPYLGKAADIHGPFFLWGFFPDLGSVRLNHRKKESYGSKQAAERARIPEALSLAVARAVERAQTMEFA